jgi:hypothetical protein
MKTSKTAIFTSAVLFFLLSTPSIQLSNMIRNKFLNRFVSKFFLVFGFSVCLSCVGGGFNFQFIFFSQPGKNVIEAISGFPFWFVDKRYEV